jgi:CDP-diacylglycerol--glycerol-3-phosphate 3-phosphatidyltransferase
MDTRALAKYIPNTLSVTRMLLVPLFILTIHDIFIYGCTNNLLLLLVFVFIIASDAADGYLARKLKCASAGGAKLDVLSDTLYTISSLGIFVYFKIIPVWFVYIMLLKLTEFVITSIITKDKRERGSVVFFDKIGKISIGIVMLLPGIFVFRCIIIEYKAVMNIGIYVITMMLTASFVSRIADTIKYTQRNQ